MSGVVIHAPNWLGDSILSRSAVAALLEWHGEEAVLVAHPRVSDLWRAWPGLTVVETHPGGWLADAIRTSRQLRALGGWDHGYLFSASFRSAATLTLAGARQRIGFAGGGRTFLLTDPVRRLPAGRMHYSREFFHLLPAEVASVVPPRFEWPAFARDQADRLLQSHGLNTHQFVAIAPGSAGAAKRYRPEAWREVISQIAPHIKVALVGTQAESPWALTAQGDEGTRVVNLCGLTDLSMLGHVLQQARVFAGADSGAAHLAAEVGCPVVVLFGPGDPAETVPQGLHVAVLRDGLWCSPCRSRVCLRPDAPSECMEHIAPDQVARAVLSKARAERAAR